MEKRKDKNRRVLVVCLAVLLVIVVGSVSTAYIFTAKTKELNQKTMFNEEKSALPKEIEQIEEQEKVNLDYELPEGAIIYDDELYLYNENIVNLLFIGVDEEASRQAARNKRMITGNQADTLLVLSINTQENVMKLINIPRDTLAEIDLLDISGNYAGTVTEPIALAHSYGDGAEVSAELVVRAVRKLMYDIPIYRYVSMNIDGIGVATDAVGGVTVKLMDDISTKDPALKKGETIKLNGKQAILYLHWRTLPGMDGTNLGSRVPRQLDFLQAFFKLAKEKTKDDISFPVALIKQLDEYVCYNVKMDEISYLTQLMLLQEIKLENIITIPGETLQEAADNYLVDDEALRALILDTFYIKQEKEQ